MVRSLSYALVYLWMGLIIMMVGVDPQVGIGADAPRQYQRRARFEARTLRQDTPSRDFPRCVFLAHIFAFRFREI